ncbi:D-alanyl-D-alanine carboxypeptidase, partial [Candidatus Daviesbacteria bacterium]|nr:D-alanyl-D-alanine carboxypeptidase [Candidatus Daviesbacteria bacterium]
ASPLVGLGQVAANVWFPQPSDYLNNLDAPQITAQGAYFVEIDTGQALYQKNSRMQLPIASLVKIMTVIITLENKRLDSVVQISSVAAAMEPDKMQLIAGEKMSVNELLDGIFLVSANDAAEALAENATGSREEFISLMNSKALQLGMKDTWFTNPTGLEEDDKKQYSSAYDVVLMARYAIKHFPQLVDITSQPHIYLPQSQDHQDYDLYSGINLLTTYPGVMGFKTGFTPEAGLTLVTLARRGDKEVLGVLLGSGDRRDEAKALLDYSFKKLGV